MPYVRRNLFLSLKFSCVSEEIVKEVERTTEMCRCFIVGQYTRFISVEGKVPVVGRYAD